MIRDWRSLYENAPAIVQRSLDPFQWVGKFPDSTIAGSVEHFIKSYNDTQAAFDGLGWERASDGMLIAHVSGSCLEGLGVSDGDYLVIDPSKRPRQAGDICLVIACDPSDFYGRLRPFLKAYKGCYISEYWVRTHYIDQAKDIKIFVRPWGFYGVAKACYTADNRLKWERDISDYPMELSTETTLDKVPGNLGKWFNITVSERSV